MSDATSTETRKAAEAILSEALTPRRKLTDEEAQAILTLVRGGWLKLEMVDHPAS
jgi:hypothetical protein